MLQHFSYDVISSMEMSIREWFAAPCLQYHPGDKIAPPPPKGFSRQRGESKRLHTYLRLRVWKLCRRDDSQRRHFIFVCPPWDMFWRKSALTFVLLEVWYPITRVIRYQVRYNTFVWGHFQDGRGCRGMVYSALLLLQHIGVGIKCKYGNGCWGSR